MGKRGKSRNAAAKRFKVTGSGKIVRRRARAAHLLTKKSSRLKRRLGRLEEASPADRQTLRRVLPSS